MFWLVLWLTITSCLSQNIGGSTTIGSTKFIVRAMGRSILMDSSARLSESGVGSDSTKINLKSQEDKQADKSLNEKQNNAQSSKTKQNNQSKEVQTEATKAQPQVNTQPSVQASVNPYQNTQAEVKTQPSTAEIKTQPPAQTKIQPTVEVKSQSAQADIKVQPSVAPAQPDPQLNAQSEVKTQQTAEVKTQSPAEPPTQVKTEPTVEVKTQPSTKPKAQPPVQQKTEIKVQHVTQQSQAINPTPPPTPPPTQKPQLISITDLAQCKSVFDNLPINPVPNVTTGSDKQPPAGAKIEERPRATQLFGNLNRTRYERFYTDENLRRVFFENVTVTTRIRKNVPESWELPVTNSNVLPFNAVITNASNFTDWEGFSEAMFIELNNIRKDPKSYIKFVQNQRNTFTGDLQYMDNDRKFLAMQGKLAWDQAISFLSTQAPLPPLRRVQCLDCAASYLISDMINPRPDSFSPHQDSTGRTASNRLGQSCLVHTGGENIAAGAFSARSMILQLVVDDNVPGRGHRENIFRNYTQVGIASGYSKEYGTITVHDFLF